MSLADASVPEVTLDITSAFTPSALPEVPNLSASSRVLGLAASIALWTAAMKPALSKPPGLAAAIVSVLAALAWASLSALGGVAAFCAFSASACAGGCAFAFLALPLMLPVSAANLG